MFISAKVKEIYAPRASDMTYISDKCFTKSELARTEHAILNCLDFQLSVHTPSDFLGEYIALGAPTARTGNLARLFVDAALLESNMLQVTASPRTVLLPAPLVITCAPALSLYDLSVSLCSSLFLSKIYSHADSLTLSPCSLTCSLILSLFPQFL